MRNHKIDFFFESDPNSVGSKGLVFVGDKVLVYRRDVNTDNHPGEIDLPGGAPKLAETPFENFRREVLEEFALDLTPDNIDCVIRYPSSLDPTRTAYFPVAKLPAKLTSTIKLGHEGTEYLLLPLDEYIQRKDGWKIFQDRAEEYRRKIHE